MTDETDDADDTEPSLEDLVKQLVDFTNLRELHERRVLRNYLVAAYARGHRIGRRTGQREGITGQVRHAIRPD